MKTVKIQLLNALDATLWAIDGKFGRYVLKPKYRNRWRWFTYGTLTILLFKFIIIPFFEWWQGVVDYINYVRWGI